MHKHLIRFLRFTDLRILYVFSAVFIIPVCLVLNRSRHTSYVYFREILGYKRLKAAWNVYVNHYRFAQIVIDKFAMYAGRKFSLVEEGTENFQRLADAPEGFLLLSSHIGNYEIAGYSLKSENKEIHAVVYGFEKESVMKNRDSMFSKTNISMICLREDMGHLFEIDNALCGGDVVSFPTDRFMGQAKSLECNFLGRSARFPQGPFSVATMRGLDVLAVNVMKEKWDTYHVYVTPLCYDKGAGRKVQMQQLLQAYVAELEKRVLQYPAQWFNFYDFWNNGNC